MTKKEATTKATRINLEDAFSTAVEEADNNSIDIEHDGIIELEWQSQNQHKHSKNKSIMIVRSENIQR